MTDTTPTDGTTTTVAAPALSVTALTPYTATIAWPAVTGATTTEVLVNGELVDSYASDLTSSYQINELWPATSYPVSVVLQSALGATLATYSSTVTTPPATGAFPRLYASSAFINTPVAANPALAANSAAMVTEAVSGYAQSANLVNNADWGIPVVTANTQSSTYNVGCQYYWCNLNFGQLHVPADAQANTGSDGHLVVLQPNGSELDMWIGQHTNNTWTAGERWITSATGPAANCTTAHGCGGANAANFALAAGLIRPEEIAQGHIDHALAITTPDTRQGYVACPATSGDGHHTSPNALPIGAHVQLDPSINVTALPIPAWQKTIATALQTYGAYVVDTGGSLGIYAESNLGRTYNAWAKAGIPDTSPSLSDLPWNNLRVLTMTQCAS
ncbi:MAG: hypothetical protein WBQ18_10365 [Solirubrobacteraceae bacterium]